MTQQPTISITINPGEALKVEVSNVQGQSCQDLTQPLEKLGHTQSTQLKPEYYQTTQTTPTIEI